METEIQETKYILSFITMKNIIKHIIHFIYYSAGIYLFWIILHFCASHLYTYLCVPLSIYGFLLSPFVSSAPHCKALSWVIYTGSNIITTMWIIIGTWICSKIFINY